MVLSRSLLLQEASSSSSCQVVVVLCIPYRERTETRATQMVAPAMPQAAGQLPLHALEMMMLLQPLQVLQGVSLSATVG